MPGKPTPKNKHPEDVKAAVRKKGTTLAALARKNDLSDSTTRASLYRPQPSGNAVVAKFLGKSLHEIWPEWFDDQGNRIPNSFKKDSSGDPVGHGQKSEAA